MDEDLLAEVDIGLGISDIDMKYIVWCNPLMNVVL